MNDTRTSVQVDGHGAQFLQCVLDCTEEGILVLDGAASVLVFNHRLRELWGIPEDTAGNVLVAEMLRKLADPGDLWRDSHGDERRDSLPLRDGRLFERYSGEFRVDDRQVRVWSFRDITERRRAEDQLRESESRFRLMADNALALIWVADTNKLCIWFNKEWLNFTGRTMEQEYGNGWAEGVHPDDLQRCIDYYVANFDRRQPFQMEYRLRRHDGAYRWIYDSGAPRFDESGNFFGYIGSCFDITDRKLSQEAIEEREAKYRLLFETANDGIFLHDQNAFIDCNQRGADMYGRTRAEVIGHSPAEFCPERQPDGSLSAEFAAGKIRDALAGTPQCFEWQALRAEGKTLDVEITLNRLQIGAATYLQAIVRDISQRREAERDMRLAASVFTNSYEGIVITDDEGVIVDVNPGFCEITGYSKDDVVGKNPRILSSGRQTPAFYADMWNALEERGSWRGEIWNRRKDGEVYAELLSISAVRDDAGSLQNYIGVFTDINRLKQHEAELSRIAYYDPLTGSPNRRLLADRLAQALARARRTRRCLAVCYLDLDGFKQINDLSGHGMGDRVLVEVANRLKPLLRKEDTFARVGGDEFVVLLSELSMPEECSTILDRLIVAVRAPIVADNMELRVSASIGVTLFPSDEADPDALLLHADQAMYQAKLAGKDCYRFYAWPSV